MTAVWQSLIPETPSTEPLALPQSPDDPQVTYYQHHPHAPSNNLRSPPNASTKPDLPCDNNNRVSHSTPHFASADTSQSPSPTIPNNHNSTDYTGKAPPFHPQPSSINCADQFWRFYADRFEGRKSRGSENRKRCLLKSGVYNHRQVNVFERTQRYVRDIFTTLVDSRWRWTLLVFSVSYVFSWLGFAIIWFIIFASHGDLEHANDRDWQPCIFGVKNFASFFLFSLETQHTIGYGARYINDNCPDAIVTLSIQSIVGILIEAFMVGVVFAKLSRPKKRSQTLVFSKNAVICQRDGKLYLMLRVGDLRNRSSLFEAHIRAQVITKRVTAEGEVIPLHQQEIKMGGYAEDEDRILLFWPTTIVHAIEADSPFYSMSAADLLKAKLELIVVLEGVVESTGMTTQLRTSYLPEEILWGKRFRDLSSYKTQTGQHLFDFDLFNSTFQVDTPLYSAHDSDHVKLLKAESVGHTGIIINECGFESPNVNRRGQKEDNLRQKRNNIELTIINGMGEARRASIDSSDEYDGNHHSGNSSDDESSDSDERKICRLSLPGGGGKKRPRSSTCTCSTNVSDSNV